MAGLATGLLALALGEAAAWRRAHLAPPAILGGLGLGGSVALMLLGRAAPWRAAPWRPAVGVA